MISEKEKQLCCKLLKTPKAPEGEIAKEEFAKRFPASLDGGRLSTKLLRSAADERDAKALSSLLIVGFTFGFREEQVSILAGLMGQEWHFDHENLVEALDALRSRAGLDALVHATQRNRAHNPP